MRLPRLGALALTGLAAVFFVALSAAAQRAPTGGVNLDEVDLDAPDPAETPPGGPTVPGTRAGPSSPTPAPGSAAPTTPTTPTAPIPGVTGDSPFALPGLPAPVPGGAAGGPSPLNGSKIFVQQLSFRDLQGRLDARAAALRNGEAGRAKAIFEELKTALLNFGLHGVPGGFHSDSIATAILREAERTRAAGDWETAAALVDVAELAAPDLVSVHATRALIKGQQRDMGGMVGSMVDAIRCHMNDPLTLSQVLARALALLVIVGLVLLCMLALLAGVPALRYLVFDVLSLLPRGAHQAQVAALVVLLAITPLVVGAGPVLEALWVLTLAWLYIPARTRVVAAGLALACFALPPAIDTGARLLAYPGSRAALAHAALVEAEADSPRRGLRARPESAIDAYEEAALALAARREGRMEEAEQRYKRILTGEAPPSFAHGAYGVLLGLTGRDDKALAELNAAAAGDEAWAAAFNISVLHYRVGRFEPATAAAAPLSREAPELLNAFRRATLREADQPVGQNREFVDVFPSTMEVLNRGLAPSDDADAAARSLHLAILGELDDQAVTIVFALFPAIWFALLVMRKKLAPSRACVRCGSPASRRVDGNAVPEDTCGQCFHAFVTTKSRVDASVKQKKERAIAWRRDWLRRIIRLLGVLWPGAGHIYAGQAFTGFALATCYGLVLGQLLLATGQLPMARLDGGWPDAINLGAAGAVLGLIWLVGVLSSWALGDAAAAGRK